MTSYILLVAAVILFVPVLNKMSNKLGNSNAVGIYLLG